MASVLGAGGGATPVLVGKGTLISRERRCSGVSGCLPWKTASIPKESNMIHWSGTREEHNSPDVYFKVVDDRLQVDLRAPYLNGSNSWCQTSINVGSDGKVVFPNGIEMGFLDASGEYGCKSYALKKKSSGTTRFMSSSETAMQMAMTGTISGSCLVLFSEIVSYKRPSGRYEVQLAYYASI